MAKSHSPQFLALVNRAKTMVREISPEETYNKIQQSNSSAIIVDVREDHEWVKGHLPKAVHLGKGIIERDIEAAIPNPQQEIILYCGGGFRSALAAQALQEMGYQNVFSLAEGFSGWLERNLPLAD